MPVFKDCSSPEKENFWKSVEAAAKEVERWPTWKQQYDLEDEEVSPLTSQEAIHLL
jgi:hypothetical protein